MKKTIMYRYLGTNGVIDSPIHLEGIYSVRSICLTADEGHVLTKDNKDFFKAVRVADEEEAALWKEVKGKLN